MSEWTRRVRPPIGPQELQQVRYAAQDVAQQASHALGKVRIVFQTVADCALFSTVLISGALASVHLWRSLFPRKAEHRQGSGGADEQGESPRRVPERSSSR
jgi:hypothetical protein